MLKLLNQMARKVRRLFSLPRFLAGRDIFIAYSRGDGSLYATALASQMASRRITTFLDQHGTEATQDLSPRVLVELRRASQLVVVASPKALESCYVAKEIDFFQSTGRSILPILFRNSNAEEPTEQAIKEVKLTSWHDAVVGIAPSWESIAFLDEGAPSQSVVARMTNATGYVRQERRLKYATALATILIAVLVTIVMWSSWHLKNAIERANTQKEAARNLWTYFESGLQSVYPQPALDPKECQTMELNPEVSIYVSPGTTVISKEGMAVLDSVADCWLSSSNRPDLIVSAYTPQVNPEAGDCIDIWPCLGNLADELDLVLQDRVSMKVKAYLISKGVDEESISLLDGGGESFEINLIHPRYPVDMMNSRVEIAVWSH